MNRTIAILVSAGLLAGTALAVSPAFADEWQNRLETEDGITEDEWQEGFGEAGVFDEWDEDGDGRLSEDEFAGGAFRSYDENQDEMLDEDEFARAEEDDMWGIF
jgi:hypothetical protein